MSQTPEEIYAQTERTHGLPGAGTDPGRVKHTIAGSADSAVKDAMRTAGAAVQDAPQQLAAKTQGNPLAAGLIAFGAGLLVSSLIPPSKAETDAAAAVREKARPLVNHAQAAGKEVVEGLNEPAQEAVENLKSTAAEAAGHVKDEGTSAAESVTNRAAAATDNVQRQR